jgi:hypothetical protein
MPPFAKVESMRGSGALKMLRCYCVNPSSPAEQEWDILIATTSPTPEKHVSLLVGLTLIDDKLCCQIGDCQKAPFDEDSFFLLEN